jgi:NH3-dependent NAD+ synthetase
MSLKKVQSVADRLAAKMKLSQTPIPGFIMGLSGTDSLIAFQICYDAMSMVGIPADRLVGIHYVNNLRRKPTWFEEHMVPWMREHYADAHILVEEPQGGNQDQQRWADLHLRALNKVQTWPEHGRVKITPFEHGKNYWTVGTINATEMYLGKYSILANSTSVQAIRNIFKTDVMLACKEMDIPQIAIDTARLPDCFCGRDELAALNIEVIDHIIRNSIDPTQHDPELLKALFAYVRETKAENDFKLRTPFIP